MESNSVISRPFLRRLDTCPSAYLVACRNSHEDAGASVQKQSLHSKEMPH